MVILVTDGVGESNLGLVTVFCHPNQARMEACDALSALCHCDSSKPCVVVVVKRYSNTPYCYIIFLKFEYISMEEISNSPAKLKLIIFFLLYEYVTKRNM